MKRMIALALVLLVSAWAPAASALPRTPEQLSNAELATLNGRGPFACGATFVFGSLLVIAATVGGGPLGGIAGGTLAYTAVKSACPV